MKENALTIEFSPCGMNGKARVKAVLNGEVIAVDDVNLTREKSRSEFCRTICNGRPGIERKAVVDELLRIAASLPTKKAPPPKGGEFQELDTSMIARPERIITPEVSGIAIPTMVTLCDKPMGRWLLYLQWSDGTRERVELPAFLNLRDGQRLWIHPQPGEPSASTQAGWSSNSRSEWVSGAKAPNAADVFRELCERFEYYVDFPSNQARGTIATLSLWSILTYAYHAWAAVPYLYFGGPLASGKSRVFDILELVAFRSITSSNMTGPALFRTVHSQGGTLLLDEAERLRQTQDPGVQELLSMLLAGYKRGGKATRLETVGETFRTIDFDVYCPKAMACIAGLPPALSSRAIHVMMFRADKDSDKPRRRIDADVAGWQRLRDGMHMMAIENGRAWLDLPGWSHVCQDMHGRAFQLWQPILALAAWIELHGVQDLLTLVQQHALACIEAATEDQVADSDETLLRILAEKRQIGAQPTAGEILRVAQELEPTYYRNWTAKAVANVLRRYGLATVTIRGRRVYSRVMPEDLQRIQTTYGLTLEMDPDEV